MAKTVGNNLDFMGTSRILNLPNPTDAQEAATRAYVDSLVEGLAWKDEVRVATASNINLSSPGATIDGVTMNTSDRVLVKTQTTASQNGIYIWNGASTPMTRSADASTGGELKQAVVTVAEGTSAGASFRQSEIDITLDTDDVIWGNFGAISPDATETVKGILELATQAETDTGTDDQRAITPLKLATWSGRTRKATANIGDGAATSYVLTHNFNTYDVLVDVFYNSSTRGSILVDMERTSVNAVTLVFSSAPTSNQFRVVVMG
jgi:hypothetical protein